MIQTTIVGFGDSLTFGYGVSQRTTYTRRLEAFLPQCYPSVNWKIQNSGINGDTTREALQRLQKDVLRHHPNIVFILFGSNDSSFLEGQYRTPYEYEKIFVLLWNKSINTIIIQDYIIVSPLLF